jgi:hypothetical protein
MKDNERINKRTKERDRFFVNFIKKQTLSFSRGLDMVERVGGTKKTLFCLIITAV